MVRSLLVEEANGEDSRSVSAEPSTMEDDLTSDLREVKEGRKEACGRRGGAREQGTQS